MGRIDLHLHSIYSDGEDTIEELLIKLIITTNTPCILLIIKAFAKLSRSNDIVC